MATASTSVDPMVRLSALAERAHQIVDHELPSMLSELDALLDQFEAPDITDERVQRYAETLKGGDRG